MSSDFKQKEDEQVLSLLVKIMDKTADDVTYLRGKMDEQGSKINDLCTRMTLTDKELQNVINDKVKNETRIYKFMSVIGMIASGAVSAFTQLKSAGLLH